MQIKFIKTRDVPTPKPATNGSCGIDISAAIDLAVPIGETVLIPTGLIISVPAGHALLILPRSSLYKKTGLRFPHSVGLIDQDYCGKDDEIMIQVTNDGAVPCTISKGDRLAQLLFIPCEVPQFLEVSSMEAQTRGGFGSTDI